MKNCRFILSVLLILCLLAPAALAGSEDFSVTESHVHAYDEGDSKWIHAVFLLENTGKKALLPAYANVVLFTSDRQVIDQSMSPMYPLALRPGEKGYVHGTFCLTGDSLAAYDHAELYLALMPLSNEEQKMADAMCDMLVYPAVKNAVAGGSVVTTITNNTAIDIVAGGVLHLYRSESGDIVGLREEFIENLKIGESVELSHTFTLAPFATVETICYSMPM